MHFAVGRKASLKSSSHCTLDGIGLIQYWLHASRIGSMQDLGLQEIFVSIGYKAVPYDEKFPTGCGGCMLKTSIEPQQQSDNSQP